MGSGGGEAVAEKGRLDAAEQGRLVWWWKRRVSILSGGKGGGARPGEVCESNLINVVVDGVM